LPGLPASSYGTRLFLDRFADLAPAALVNVAGHPPVLLLFAHLTALTALTTPGRFAVFRGEQAQGGGLPSVGGLLVIYP
jgi:hypothetical protein